MDVIAFGFGDAQSPGRAHRDRVITAAVDFVDRRGRWCTQCSRSLAAALGTSDRMRIYHFGSKDALIADVGDPARAHTAAVLFAELIEHNV